MVSDTVDSDKQPEVIGKEFNVEENKIKLVNNYVELKTAIYSFGGKIALGSDITTTSTIQMRDTLLKGSHDIYLNLNSHTYTYRTTTPSNANPVFSIKEGVSVIVEGNGTICVPENRNSSIFHVYSNGKLTINGGTYLDTNNDSSHTLFRGGYDTSDGGEIIINGGKFVSKDACFGLWQKNKLTINNGEFSSENNFIIGTIGSEGYGNNIITINGGTFNAKIAEEGYIACGVYLANADTLIVNGGTFNVYNGCGILVRSGNATIGKNVIINLNIDGTILSGKVGDSTINVDINAAIVMDEKSGYKCGKPTVINNSNYQVQVISD